MTDTFAGSLMRRYDNLRRRNADRDVRMAQVKAVRNGRVAEVAPDLFPSSGPWQEPITANMIDVAARDLAEMIAPLPAVNCWSPSMTSASAQKKADTRTKIATGLVTASDLQTQMYSGADWYLTYSFLPGRVEVDPSQDKPVIRLIDPTGCYPYFDRFDRCLGMFQRLYITAGELRDLYPEVAGAMRQANRDQFDDAMVEVVLHHDKDFDTAFLPSYDAFILYRIPNPVGECLIRVARRPGPQRGQFDDVMFVQLAKARFALLQMEAAHKAVQAPIVLPPDVNNVPVGPDAIIRTSSPAAVGRVKLDMPPTAFAQQAALDSELRNGARFPEVRTGNMDSSVVTGRGVQALMGGFDTQVKTAQAIMARFLSELIALTLRVEERLYGHRARTLSGLANGTPFEVKYTPSRDIGGDYSVDVQYGLLAGLDPNRWLVFGLQAMGGKLVSRDFMRRQMPADIDAGEEERKVDIEDMREALKAGVLGMAKAIPSMVTQGQDPNAVLHILAEAISGRKAGRPIEELLQKALEPPKPENPPESPEAAGVGESPQPASGMPAMAAPGGGEGPQSLAQLLSGLNSRGEASMQAQVSRQVSIS